MNQLVQKAKELLTSGEAAYIIGYAEDKKGKTVPCIARNSESAEKLVFNHHSINNLAVYLKRIKKFNKGKIAVVAKGCDIRAIVALVQENQVRRDSIIIIGMNCNGVVKDSADEWKRENVQIKCKYCQLRTPRNADFIIGELKDFELPEDYQLALMEKIEAWSPEDRRAFFEESFAECIKCYACRQVCPLCYCEQCITNKSMPRWIESGSTKKGNFSWNIIRAFHLAGRCIGCHECERVCPVNIPLTLLTRKMGVLVMKEFNYRHGSEFDQPTLVGVYNVSDKEDFIK